MVGNTQWNDLTNAQRQQIKALTDNALGKGYFTPLPDFDYWLIAHSETEPIMAYATVGKARKQYLHEHTPNPYSLVAKTIVVQPKHQGKGLGTILLQNIVNHATHNHCLTLYVPAWWPSNKPNPNLKNLVQKLNFVHLKTIINAYDNYQGLCPVCGIGCKCKAVIYQKDLKK